ncbi:NACHT domain-containing protein [Fictibacillus halophilus]|uniref:NACHT domain-containing protein n=1 Tax=Fictibacillus halophilus TaxID=1610490 RepID=UPI00363D9E46
MIDWSKLKPYDTDQKRSFEELCYQIARVQFDDIGIFTSVDDSGGGDGVEFFLTLANGEEWGWQAKFYLEGRLVQGRKSSIIGSLKKSLEVHPNLKKWYLCIPMDLTVGEKEWFNTTLKGIVGEKDVELYFWGESEFNYYLGSPEYAGRKNYFFGDLELTFDWFNTQVANQLSSIKGKYNPAVHTQTEVDLEIDSILLNEGYRQYLMGQRKSLLELIKNIEPVLSKIQNIKTSLLPLRIKKEYLLYIQKAIDKCEVLLSLFKEEISLHELGYYPNQNAIPFNEVLDDLLSCITNLREKDTSIDETFLIVTKDMDQENKNQITDTRSTLWKPIEIFEEIYYVLKLTVTKVNRSRSSNLNIFGNAGYGKTHVTAHIAKETIDKGLPAIFISGKNIADTRILTEQLLSNLDIPRNYSWTEFLKALDVAGKAFRTKIPIFIDGLNEIRDISVIKNGLHGIIKEITSFNNICLITTCRITYIKEIFEEKPCDSVFLKGFSEENLVEAIKSYFNYYKIKSDISAVSLEAFEHPLYLQIFCETKNPERVDEQKVYINEHSIFDIFETYLHNCNQKLSEKLNLNPRRKIIINKLLELGKSLWERSSRFISITHAGDILEYNPATNWNDSVEKNLTDENLLIYRDWYQEEEDEVITFTYDLLGGFIIAKYLLEEHKLNLHEFLNNTYTVQKLFGEEYQLRHPLHEDISRCIAAMLPLYEGNYLIDYIENKTTLNLTVNSFFEMSPEYVSENAKDLIKSLFSKPGNRNPFFHITEKTFRQVGHPLNIHFWSELISSLSMAERDVSWSEHIRGNVEGINESIEALEKLTQNRQIEIDSYTNDYLQLLAEYVMWTLTSTIRTLRDRATRALYYFGRLFPEEFFDLLKYSFNINDPYVSERMLAALYGIGMAKQFDFNDDNFRKYILPEKARELYSMMFAEGAENFTTHILSRDYARKFIEMTLIHHPNFLKEDEKENLYPPYNEDKVLKWGTLDEEDISKLKYQPIKMDFENYTIGRLVENRSNYDYEHEDYKKVRSQIYWRIYNLGFSSELFSDIDNELERRNFRHDRSGDGRKTDRYGKKYSWIAYFELAGYRDDQGLLVDDWYLEEQRISETDIDPSFPIEIPNTQIVTKDYFAEYLPIDEWLFGDCVPDFDEYLQMEEINGEKGPWVLLDGYFSDENQRQTRSCFFFPRGLLVKNVDFEKVTFLLRRQTLGGRWIPDASTDYYVFAGEIPWSNMFKTNNKTELKFITQKEKELVPVEHRVLVKDGERLTHTQVSELKQMLLEDGKIDVFSSLITLNHSDWFDETSLEEFGIRIEKEIIEEEQEKKVIDIFHVLLPVRDNSWEENKSSVIPSRNVTTPCREITTTLDLIGQPQTFDLYEKNGQKASIICEYGVSYRNRQNFTYLRKDLLDKFLEQEGYRLIWGLWGEKEVSYKDKAFRDFFDSRYGEIRKEFQDIVIYDG